MAALLAEGLVDLQRVAQDGMRVRASAGAASFRRRPTLEEALAEAEAQVEALRAELEQDPAAGDRRRQAARQRAARECAERIREALDRLPELEARKKPEDREKARCSTTDAGATVMKMGDGGFRPAYNFEFATATDSQLIVGVEVVTVGSDAGQMVPMVEQIDERYDQRPGEMLVDGGFAQHDQIDAVSGTGIGCTVYAPVPQPKDETVDRYAPKPGDSPAVAAWRERMGGDEAKAIYKERAATAECVNGSAESGVDPVAGAGPTQGQGDRAVVCVGTQPDARGEPAGRGRGARRGGGRGVRRGRDGPGTARTGGEIAPNGGGAPGEPGDRATREDRRDSASIV